MYCTFCGQSSNACLADFAMRISELSDVCISLFKREERHYTAALYSLKEFLPNDKYESYYSLSVLCACNFFYFVRRPNYVIWTKVALLETDVNST